MIYTANISIDKDTAKTDLDKTVLHVTKGLVYKVDFYFPPGPGGLMGIAVFDGLYQVWPSNIGEFFASDDETISFDDPYLKIAAPFEFVIYTYNEDDTNNHKCSVRIGLVSNEVYMERFLPNRTIEDFTRLLAKMEDERAERARVQILRRKETPFEWMMPEVE